jgi:hypothetical protein
MTPQGRLRLLTDVGADRYASRDELTWPSDRYTAWLDDVWHVYQEQFDGFTGSRLDPEFDRFTHPAPAWGRMQVDAATTLLVVATGPSLAGEVEALRRVRDRLLVATSPRGAEALDAFGLGADLIVVEHASALDAHTATDRLGRCESIGQAWVAAELRTPRELLAGVRTDRLFVPQAWPGWGLWPATAVALGLGAGAGRIGLLGVDLGSPLGVAPEFMPLAGLLGLLARTGVAACVDYGTRGAVKEGWAPGDLSQFDAAPRVRPPHVETWPIGDRHFISEAARWRAGAEPLVMRARQALAMAIIARDGGGPEPARMAADIMRSWGADAALRTTLQEMLGVTFLPRIWRAGIDLEHPERLWRPVILAVHELVAQVDRLDAVLGQQEATAVGRI